MMKGYWVIALYGGNFSYGYVTENSTTIYDDKIIKVVDTKAQALTTISLLEEGYKFGYLDGLAEND